MKRSLLTLIAFAALSLTAGAEPKKPEAKPAEKAPVTKPADAKEAKPKKALPFHGGIKEVDAKASTFLVGKTTLHITDTTEIKMGDKPATATDVAVGMDASGSYVDNNGVKDLVKLTLKAKEEKAAAKDAKKEEKAADKPATAPEPKKAK